MAWNVKTLRQLVVDHGTHFEATLYSRKYDRYVTIKVSRESMDDPDVADVCWTLTFRKDREGRPCVSYCTRVVKRPDGRSTSYLLHRVVLGAPPRRFVDHINGDVTDNRLENLRLATPRQSVINRRLSSRNRTGKSGVFPIKRKDGSTRFTARVYTAPGEYIRRSFQTLDEAVKWREEMEREHYGEWVREP